MSLRNGVRKIILKFLDWVVDDKESKTEEPRMSFFPASHMVVKGFMRDYRLLSKIDPKHFSSGAGNPIITNIGFSNDDEEEVRGDYVQTIPEDVEVTLRRGSMPAFNRRHTTVINAQDESGKPISKSMPASDGPNPKTILEELSCVPNPADMVDLDKKIEAYLRIHELIRVDASRGNKETIQDVIQRLKNRKLYRDNEKYRMFFESFKYTTDESINLFLDKYTHLKIGPADDFIPEMPADAHEKLLAYTDHVVEMCQCKPVFYLIAKTNDFKTVANQRKERDPILLVQSPIGLFWQIIGAWGEEDMILVNDL